MLYKHIRTHIRTHSDHILYILYLKIFSSQAVKGFLGRMHVIYRIDSLCFKQQQKKNPMEKKCSYRPSVFMCELVCGALMVTKQMPIL